MNRSSINDHNKLDFIGMYDELLITSISFIFLLNAQVKFKDELHWFYKQTQFKEYLGNVNI